MADESANYKEYGLYKYYQESGRSLPWSKKNGAIGDEYPSLVLSKDLVRMKYKSSPHLVLNASVSDDSALKYVSEQGTIPDDAAILPIVEIVRDAATHTTLELTRFGGKGNDALQAHSWIPCGEPVDLTDNEGEALDDDVDYEYSYGDTYFQRWDSLKTYPFTPEDENQVIEIGSFMLESRINADGRYDRNRGQLNNLNMSPTNFNLFNGVYSQQDNFFSFKILDNSFYELNKFANQITWSKTKQPGSFVDAWTDITLASTYDLDGSKGKIISINTWKDSIYCFQEKGISKILFNSRVQVPVSDGVPIEITNSNKVDGYVYLTEDIGCNSKTLIQETPAGIYFIDSNSRHLFCLTDQLIDVSQIYNMTSWFEDSEKGHINKLLYDNVHKDLYICTETESLCFSEIIGQFTGFMDYNDMSLLESYNKTVFSLHSQDLYKMFEGRYNEIFGSIYPWGFTFISNGLDNGTGDLDKIFTNIDYRMDMFDTTGLYQADETFDTIQVSDEYQNTGEKDLCRYVERNKIFSNHWHWQGDTNLQKKFRIWRVQIPRGHNSRNRMRNPWCKISLKSNGTSLHKAVFHNLNIQYYAN